MAFNQIFPLLRNQYGTCSASTVSFEYRKTKWAVLTKRASVCDETEITRTNDKAHVATTLLLRCT